MTDRAIHIQEPKNKRIRLLQRRQLSQGAQERLLTHFFEQYTIGATIRRSAIESFSANSLTLDAEEVVLANDEAPLFVVVPIEDLADEIRNLTERLTLQNVDAQHVH